MNIRRPPHPPGFSSLGFIGYLSIMALLIIGGQGVYVALKNETPLEISVADYIAKKPNAEWMTLRDAQVSLVEAAYKARLGRVSEVYIPVRPAGESLSAPVHILLCTQDEAVASALKALSQSKAPVSQKVGVASRQADRLFMRQDITGMTRYGIFYDLFMKFRLSQLNLQLADDFVILDDGASPSLTTSLGMFGGGLLIWVVMLCHTVSDALWRWRRRRAFYRQRPRG